MIYANCADMPANIDSTYICFLKKRKNNSLQLKSPKQQKKEQERIKYEKSKLPESGYMTLEEYEEKSRAKTRKEIAEEVLDKPDLPKDKSYIYVPQHIYKLVRYNEPVGSPELNIPRRLFYDRQVNAQGIVSGDYKKLVYPAIYYYAELDSVSCDLFVINLDETVNNLERVKKANILNKDPNPILSTKTDTTRKAIFRTLTPIDYSIDSTKLLIKEKIGSRHDGIWKTDVWIYDFETKKAKNLTLLRNAICYYWNKTEKLELENKRWDVYPIGFDANNSNRIIVCAYAYTGGIPKFLGTWSIDINNENVKLESKTGAGIPVSVVGFKISKEHDVRPMSELEAEAKRESAELKKKAKEELKQKKAEEKEKKQELKEKLKKLDDNSDETWKNRLLKFKNPEQEETIEPANDKKNNDTTEITIPQKEVKPSQENNENTIKEEVEVKEEVEDTSKNENAQTEINQEQEKDDVNEIKPVREFKQEPAKIEYPDLDAILEKFKKDAGITPEQEAENELYDLDELDNLE